MVWYPSQYGQDKYLHENYFKDKKDGIFLDIGAYDGVVFSNTYFFEKEMGWTGICVEPNPKVFTKLEKNRSCTLLNYAVSLGDGEKDFLQLSGYSEQLSGLVESCSKKHITRIHRELKSKGGEQEVISVKTTSVNNILSLNNIDHIDYCSIDTEGNEFNILRSIDFSKYMIDFFTIENPKSGRDVRDFLESKKYTLIDHVGIDDVFKRDDDTN